MNIYEETFSVFFLQKKRREKLLRKILQKYHHYLPEKLVVTKEHLSSTGEWLVELPESTSQTSTSSVSASVKKNIEINIFICIALFINICMVVLHITVLDF